MKSIWKVHRTVAARADGPRRWDYAYQFLLQGARASSADTGPAPTPQEESNERGHLRPGLAPTAPAGADD
jgi:hypothetical protein